MVIVCMTKQTPKLIDVNTVRGDDGGVRAETSSLVTLGDAASVSRNTARGSGGGLSLLTTSSNAFMALRNNFRKPEYRFAIDEPLVKLVE